jgi:hypothetical protein
MDEESLAKKLLEWLWSDLNDRSGFDTGNLDSQTIKEWKESWYKQILKTLLNERKSWKD